jgi:protoheme IX farnesyltransferase
VRVGEDVTTLEPRTIGSRFRAYVALTKPRIIELLLITTVPAMILAEGGWPGLGLVAGTVGGGALSAGGANAINNVVDRDIDAKMRRTKRRPLPAETASVREALVLGLMLGAAGFVVLWAVANVAAALLATGALAFYVLIYTLYLKRTTPQNIVIGGAAGAVPALVGWAAVTGGVGLPAWLLFAVVFYWTPPHFWALALRFRSDYEAAGVPMLPVVAGERATAVQIVLYTLVVAGAAILLQPAAGLGAAYVGVAAVGSVAFAAMAARLLKDPQSAMRVFQFSNVYLAVLFAAVALDVLIGDPAAASALFGWLGAGLVVVGSFAIVAVTRPLRGRELVFVLVPAAGSIAVAAAVLTRI